MHWLSSFSNDCRRPVVGGHALLVLVWYWELVPDFPHTDEIYKNLEATNNIKNNNNGHNKTTRKRNLYETTLDQAQKFALGACLEED